MWVRLGVGVICGYDRIAKDVTNPMFKCGNTFERACLWVSEL